MGAFVLDVREDHEFTAGHVPGAVHIAMNDVPERLADVPTDRQVMVICQSGGRSRAIADYLKAQGVDAFNVTEGTQGWGQRGWPLDR
ncbi:rhodanese-like domain-containing protein [Nocardioides sp.]|uniref:rhodanese-like domain-containing protein n=1 Tax=Nocardioides sp. TaxID=35761 RepID=UPI002C5FB9DA|nr:rhodanese-like domain-containing protein [Nocardioides sp.]HXH78551.1 rhodanese-like domain-containing protein [Nocardioides sp.]